MEDAFYEIRGLINDLTIALTGTIVHIDNLLLTLDRDCKEFNEAWLANGQLEQAIKYFLDLRSVFLGYQEWVLSKILYDKNKDKISIHRLHELLTVLNITSDLFHNLPSEIDKNDIFLIIKEIVTSIKYMNNKDNILELRDFSEKENKYDVKHIMLVEDDNHVRNILSKALKIYGYSVYDCETGEKASLIFNTKGPQFKLFIIDINLPDINGVTLVNGLLSKIPDIKILLITGGSDDIIHSNPIKYNYLQKPFGLKLFITTVNNLIQHKN